MLVNDEEVRQALRLEIKLRHGRSYSAFAAAAGVGRSTVYRTLQGKMPPGEKILAALGYERVVGYRRL